MKSIEEIYEQIDKAGEQPDKYPGMSYMDGVKEALEWVIEQTEEAPTD